MNSVILSVTDEGSVTYKLDTILYHGSNMIVKEPKILLNGYYKDFGYGFYCTNMKKQAVRWALTKRGNAIVNSFKYTPNVTLSILNFSKMSNDWLDFIASCRKGIEHSYDIVEGPMADDQIWNYVEGFLEGKISREAFWSLAKFNYPTHQIVFCNEIALRTLTYEGSDIL